MDEAGEMCGFGCHFFIEQIITKYFLHINIIYFRKLANLK